MAVLPPTEASTCANKVVGIRAKSTPLWYVDAENPTKSQIIPPPKPIKRQSLLY